MIAIQIKLVPLAIVERVLPRTRAHLRLVPGDDVAVPVTTHGLLDDWLARCDQSPLARSTLVGYRCAANNLYAHLPDVPAEPIGPAELQAAVSSISRERGPAAGLAAKCLFGTAWRWGVANRKLPQIASPTALVQAASPNKRRETWVPAATVTEIIAAAGKLADERKISVASARLIELSIETGQRLRSDMTGLRVGQLLVTAKGPVLLLEIHKSNVWRRLPLSPEAADLIRRCEADAPLTGWLFPGRKGGHLKRVYTQWAKILERVEQQGHNIYDVRGARLVPHQMRHAFASHCLDAGISPADVGRALCQTDPRSIEEYAAVSPDMPTAPALTFARLIRGKNPMPDTPTTTFAERLRAAANGRTAAQLAEALTAAGYTIGERQAGNLLNGSSKPPGPDEIAMICRALGCPADVLLGLSNG